MRYTVLTYRTFHNRIAKSLGVLVGAALVATLGLPSAGPGTDASGADGDRRGRRHGRRRRHHYRNVGAAAGFQPRWVAARIYRAWRSMGRCDEDGDFWPELHERNYPRE